MPQDKPSWFEHHATLTLTISLLLGFILLLAIAEGIARVWLPHWAPMTAERSQFWQFDSTLGWKHKPSVRGQFNHPDFSVSVSINSQGMRDREYPLTRSDKKRMLVLGDSYGWGFGVEQAEVFTELLESAHTNWEIINASVSGYGTVQQFLYYQQLAEQYDPDLVLLLFYDNDFQDNIGITSYWYDRPVIKKRQNKLFIDQSEINPPNIKQKAEVALLGNFYLGRIFYALLSPLLDLAVAEKHEAVDDDMDSLSATTFILDQFFNSVTENGSLPIVVSTPLSDIKENAIVISANKYQAPYLHLSSVFKKGKKQAWHFTHDRHWNGLGHQMAADAIDDFLQQQGLWQ